MIQVTRLPWASGTSGYNSSMVFVFSDPENPRETKLNSFRIKFLNIPGDDPSDQVALGTRYVGTNFEWHIRVQRPQKPPSKKLPQKPPNNRIYNILLSIDEFHVRHLGFTMFYLYLSAYFILSRLIFLKFKKKSRICR